MSYTLSQLIVAGEVGKLIQIFTEPPFTGAPPYTLQGTVTCVVAARNGTVRNVYACTIGNVPLLDLAGNTIAAAGQWAEFATTSGTFPAPGGAFQMQLIDSYGGNEIIAASIGVTVNPTI